MHVEVRGQPQVVVLSLRLVQDRASSSLQRAPAWLALELRGFSCFPPCGGGALGLQMKGRRCALLPLVSVYANSSPHTMPQALYPGSISPGSYQWMLISLTLLTFSQQSGWLPS